MIRLISGTILIAGLVLAFVLLNKIGEGQRAQRTTEAWEQRR